MGSLSPLSSLTCQEDITLIDDDDDDSSNQQHLHDYEAFMHRPEAEDEYIQMLLSEECSFISNSFGDESLSSIIRCQSVHWILRMKLQFGFSLQTTYLAVFYFDRFLARRSIDEGKAWAWRLLSIACLSLAAKMEELNPPALSEFGVEEYHFDTTTIQRMELMVLSTMEWRMNLVTPFAYLGYFAFKLEADIEIEFFSRAVWFIFAIARAMNLVDCRPSAIAAAAVLAASDRGLTKNSVKSKISALSLPKYPGASLPEYPGAEQVFLCYRVMIEEPLRPERQASGNSSVDSPSFKRRRLQ